MKVKAGLGLAAAVILLLSAGAHSIAGWPTMRDRLVDAKAPTDLIQGLQIGWIFGGFVMVILAMICFNIFWKRFAGERVSTFAPMTIAVGYLAFAVWSLMLTGGDPFAAIFILPAVLLLVASL